MKPNSALQKALKVALSSRSNSYSPYSHFSVGAALKLKGEEEPIGGCNIENASFGATMCAERVALFTAVARSGKGFSPEFLLVATGESAGTVPCALCLQALAEFCPDEFPIHLSKGGIVGEAEIVRTFLLKDLLPHPFRVFQAEKKP
jgi:cytidine deaminase